MVSWHHDSLMPHAFSYSAPEVKADCQAQGHTRMKKAASMSVDVRKAVTLMARLLLRSA